MYSKLRSTSDRSSLPASPNAIVTAAGHRLSQSLHRAHEVETGKSWRRLATAESHSFRVARNARVERASRSKV